MGRRKILRRIRQQQERIELALAEVFEATCEAKNAAGAAVEEAREVASYVNRKMPLVPVPSPPVGEDVAAWVKALRAADPKLSELVFEHLLGDREQEGLDALLTRRVAAARKPK